MKLLFLGDIHYGVRNDNPLFLDYNKTFFDNVLFPYLDEHKIKSVIQMGDLFDRRKYCNIYTAHRLKTDFIEPLMERGIDYHQIIGNHDCFFKNTNKVNSISSFLSKYPIKVYTDPTEVEFDGIKLMFIPWINRENRQQTLKIMGETNAQIAVGHLEIQGFEMYKGSLVSYGDDRNLFSRFDLVFSGHYHHKSSDGSIFYLGSIGEFIWSDYNDPKGVHIFDTETREITFVPNPYKVFKKVFYDDTDPNFIKKKIDFSQYTDCFVKVVILEKNNMYLFDKFVDSIEKSNPSDLQIVEDHLNLNLESETDIVSEAESTLDIFNKHIDTIEAENLDKEKLKLRINELYHEAVALE